jgi:hypothetical protein
MVVGTRKPGKTAKFILKEIKKAQHLLSFLMLYTEWESNPHSEEHEFESCASTNSAISAII